MKKIAVVVQRCGDGVVGGSEGYAYQMARYLSGRFKVDVLTTTARDYTTWENSFAEGTEEISETFRIKRFKVDFQRGRYWQELNRVLFTDLPLDRFPALEAREREAYLNGIKMSPIGLQEEWIKQQGPYSSDLFRYIGEESGSYDIIIFMTYLYPTTYFGIEAVKERKKIFIVPTLHDEPPAHLGIFKKYSGYRQLYLTGAEKELAEKILGARAGGETIGFGLEDRFDEIARRTVDPKYLLYAGRLDEAKGVRELFSSFERFSKTHGELRLYTIGDGELKSYRHANIEYLGFVSEDEKLALMKNALAFVHPSSLESLGIVLIESFMMGTPALVNGRGAVLRGHIEASGGGYHYNSYGEFEKALEVLIREDRARAELGDKARRYFLNNYSAERFTATLASIFEDVALEGTQIPSMPDARHNLKLVQ